MSEWKSDPRRNGKNRPLIVDGHCDAPYRLYRHDLSFDAEDPSAQIDLTTMKQGGINASFFVAYVPAHWVDHGAAGFAHRLIDIIERECDRHEDLELAKASEDIERIHAKDGIAILIGIEGGHAIEDSLETLERFRDRGVRYMTLTHVNHNNWADTSSLPPRHGGLTNFGKSVVRRMNELGVFVDVSHVSDDTFYDALEVSSAPVIASHSSCRAIANHPRNLTDQMLRDLASAGGLCMINFFSGFVVEEAAVRLRELEPSSARRVGLREELPDDAAYWTDFMKRYGELSSPAGTIRDLGDHFVHAAYVAGVDAVGVGTDFDGVPSLPEGLETAAGMPLLIEHLGERGFSDEEVRKILGGNFMRVMKGMESTRREGGS